MTEFFKALSGGKKAKEKIGKRHWLVIIMILIFIGLIGAFFYSLSSSHSGIFSYQAEFYYSPYLSAIGSFLTPITSLTSEASCVLGGFSGGSNFYNCFYTSTKPVVHNNATFTSFVSISTPAQTQQLILNTISGITPQSDPQYVYYTIRNVGNTELGPNSPNKLLVSLSCSGTTQPSVCSNYTEPSSSQNSPLFTPQPFQTLFPGQQFTNSTNLAVYCPSVKSMRPPAPIQVNIVSTVTNYPSATVFPIVFVNKQYVKTLVSSQQSFYAQQPSEDFVSPGPVEIVANYQGQMPILNSTKLIPITIQMTNSGQGNAAINSFDVFFNSTDFSASSLIVGGYTINTAGDCKPATASTILSFDLPGTGYMDCKVPSSYFKAGINTVINLNLNMVNFNSNFHFDTLPIILYTNYNYSQSQADTLNIANYTQGCTS